MAKLEELLAIGVSGAAVEVRRNRQANHPNGWEPRLELHSTGGFLVTDPLADEPEDWKDLLDNLLPESFDKTKFNVDERYPIEVRAWDGEGGTKRLYYFKAKIKRLDVGTGVDLDELIEKAKKLSIGKKKELPKVTNRVYFQQITDLQAGQSDGDGVEGMINKVLELASFVKQDLDELKKQGRPVDKIFIPITGDLVEGINGWYDMQTFSVQLDRRDQVKVVRRLLLEYIAEISKLGLPIHVAVVPGNHGENRLNGKAFTTLNDNDDVAVVEQVAEAISYAHPENAITWSFPQRNRLSLTVEVLGWIVGLTHGHLARGGTGVEGRILAWFKSMAAVRDPIGDSDILFTGHYHHARYQQLIGQTHWLQGGALCDRSDWFSQSAGLVSSPAIWSGTITTEAPVEILRPRFWPLNEVESRKIDEPVA
jgi:predicted phosphodiesterase